MIHALILFKIFTVHEQFYFQIFYRFLKCSDKTISFQFVHDEVYGKSDAHHTEYDRLQMRPELDRFESEGVGNASFVSDQLVNPVQMRKNQKKSGGGIRYTYQISNTLYRLCNSDHKLLLSVLRPHDRCATV